MWLKNYCGSRTIHLPSEFEHFSFQIPTWTKPLLSLCVLFSVHTLLSFLIGWNCLPWLSVVEWNVSMYALSGASHKLATHKQHSSAVPLLDTSTQCPGTSLYMKSFTRPSPMLVLWVTCLGKLAWARGCLSMRNFSSWQLLYFWPTYSSREREWNFYQPSRVIIEFVPHMLTATEDTIMHIPGAFAQISD